MKRQLATEWLIEQIEQSLLTLGYSGTKNKLRILKKQAKQKEIENLEESNIAGMEFIPVDPNLYKQDAEQYVKETYEIYNKK